MIAAMENAEAFEESWELLRATKVELVNGEDTGGGVDIGDRDVESGGEGEGDAKEGDKDVRDGGVRGGLDVGIGGVEGDDLGSPFRGSLIVTLVVTFLLTVLSFLAF